jgi:hypothetical protein
MLQPTVIVYVCRFYKKGQVACPWPLQVIPDSLGGYGFRPKNSNLYCKYYT